MLLTEGLQPHSYISKSWAGLFHTFPKDSFTLLPSTAWGLPVPAVCSTCLVMLHKLLPHQHARAPLGTMQMVSSAEQFR